MQSSSSFCNNSVPWVFSNLPHDQTLHGNFLGRNTVSVQETSQSNSLDVSQAFGFSDRIEVIDPMNLETNHQSMAICSSDNRRKSGKRAWGAFLPLAMDIIKCSATQTSSPSADGFQMARYDTEHRVCSRNDNECPPSSPIDIFQQTHNPLPSISASTSTSTSTSTSSKASKRPRTDRRTHGSAPSRNRQATSDQVEDILVKLSLCRMRPKDQTCPVTGCQYKQLNGRMPDFRRHVKTHIRKDGEIRCKGVPWQEFIRRSHLYPKISVDQQPYAVPDEDGQWIGGCLKTFSRADALKRHLRNTSCAGHHNGQR